MAPFFYFILFQNSLKELSKLTVFCKEELFSSPYF